MSVTGVRGLRVWVPCVFESSPAKYVPTLLLVGANVKPKMREVRRDLSRRWLAATLRDSLDNIAYWRSSSSAEGCAGRGQGGAPKSEARN